MASDFRGLASFEKEMLDLFAKGQNQLAAFCPEPAFSQLLCLLLSSAKNHRNLCIVCPLEKQVQEWVHFLEGMRGFLPEHEILFWPNHGFWGKDRYSNEDHRQKERLFALSSLFKKKNVLVASAEGLSQFTASIDSLRKETLLLKKGEEISYDDLVSKLKALGYHERTKVEMPGFYALKGSLLDIFACNSKEPVRLEFFGDTLETMRVFDPSTQISVSEVLSLSIGKAQEFLIDHQDSQIRQKLYDELLKQGLDAKDNRAIMESFASSGHFGGMDIFRAFLANDKSPLIDYLKEDTQFFFPSGVQAALSHFEHLSEVRRDMVEKADGLICPRFFWHHLALESLKSKLFALPTVQMVDLSQPGALLYSYKADHWIPGAFSDKLASILAEGLRVLVHVPIGIVLNQVHGLLKDQGFKAEHVEPSANFYSVSSLSALATDKILLVHGELSGNFWDYDLGILFVALHTLFPSLKRQKKAPKRNLKDYLKDTSQIKKGDYIVHEKHGIGLCLGLLTFKVDGVLHDFVHLEYLGKDRIYVPVDRIQSLKRHSPGEGSEVKLDRLGGTSFSQRKKKAKAHALDIAKSLLATHAKRKLAQARTFADPPQEYFDFVDDFPYPETEDQLRAISDIEGDLKKSEVMDRIIVGDVGFGKTEVALRAAMRVILAGYQVLVLVPTTILADQHYESFLQRLSPYGVELAILSRFVGKKEQERAIDLFAQGKLDLMVGTHRLLSKDIKAKNLGLIIVDEEQKFGVVHKEKLKALRVDCAVLMMTATPIPRTLHMATLGLRDVSILATPPQNRLAIRTHVGKFDSKLLKEAIESELARGGQVFFVHNRTQDLSQYGKMILDLVPHAKVVTAHGQMSASDLEPIMADFVKQRFNVLVATTIVESGLDLPNANTLIVNKAENFGLASLYQLRGRVGRSITQAYAYFFASEAISEEAQARLEVLMTHQELGAGFHIASHDMDLRGVGNILGDAQAGHVDAIGLELYSEYLAETIRELQGEVIVPVQECEIKIKVEALIPTFYIREEAERLAVYKDLFSLSHDESYTLAQNLSDRYGPLPFQVRNLFALSRLKKALEVLRASRIVEKSKERFEISFFPLDASHIVALKNLVAQNPGLSFSPDFKLEVFIAAKELGAFDGRIDKIAEILKSGASS